MPDFEDQESIVADKLYQLVLNETKDNHAIYDYTKQQEAEFRNVPIETLIKDPYFLNLGNYIYDSHVEDIKALWEERKKRPINLALFQESIGCVIGNTWTYTKEGPKRIGNICHSNIIGSHVWEEELTILTPTGFELTSYLMKTGEEKTKIITSRFGYELEGTFNHPLETICNGKIISRKLDDFNEGDYIAIDSSKKPFGLSNELSADLGYLMGYMIGDGHITYRGFTATCHEEDSQIIHKVKSILEEYFEGATLRPKKIQPHLLFLRAKVGINKNIKKFINTYDLAHLAKDKIVPESVFGQTENTVRSFLQGLFDADGSFCKNKFSISAKNKECIAVCGIAI